MKKAFALLLLCLTLTACSREPAAVWQEQYDLGVRYLSEGSYQEAVLAFTAVIEIEPNLAEAYSGRADAYIAAAQESADEALAAEYLRNALSDYEAAAALGDTAAEEKAQRIREQLEKPAPGPEAEPEAAKAPEETEAPEEAEMNGAAAELLAPLYALLSQGDLEGAKALMRSDEYRELSETAPAGSLVYREELTLAVYADCYYYFGQQEDGLRSGNGLWIRAVYGEDTSKDCYLYEGAWANDLPNGEGRIVITRDVSKTQLTEGRTISVRTEITGSFKDGLYDGVMLSVWYMNDGGIHEWTPITAIDGVYQPMADVPEEILERGYYAENIEEGEYLIALDQLNDLTDLWDDGDVNSVPGLFDTKS